METILQIWKHYTHDPLLNFVDRKEEAITEAVIEVCIVIVV